MRVVRAEIPGVSQWLGGFWVRFNPLHEMEMQLRKRFAAAAALIAVLTAGGSAFGSSVLSAKAGDAGSPGNKGLCNAYAHNNEHAKNNGQAFVRLAATAGDYDGDGDRDADDVTSYCADNVAAVGKPA